MGEVCGSVGGVGEWQPMINFQGGKEREGRVGGEMEEYGHKGAKG